MVTTDYTMKDKEAIDEVEEEAKSPKTATEFGDKSDRTHSSDSSEEKESPEEKL